MAVTYDVLICTDPERERSLSLALASLVTQTFLPTSVLLSTDRVETPQCKLSVRMLQLMGVPVNMCDTQGRHMNERLNEMLHQSHSQYILTMDDDNFLKSDTAKRWLIGAQGAGACTGIQVMVNDPNASPLPGSYKPQSFDVQREALKNYNTLYAGWRSDKTQFQRCVQNTLRPADIFYNAYVISREALDEVNGWDDVNLKSVGGEVDLALRLREAGYRHSIHTDEYFHYRAPVERPCNAQETREAEAYLDSRYP